MKRTAHSPVGRLLPALLATLLLAGTATWSGEVAVDLLKCEWLRPKGTFGNVADLPDGYVAWLCLSHGKPRGIFTSPLRKFEPAVVPKTENDAALTCEISDDGTWIVYLAASAGQDNKGNPAWVAPFKVVLVKKDGSAYAEVPGATKNLSDAREPGAGFVRRSPFGDPTLDRQTQKVEVWYQGEKKIWAVQVDLSQEPPKFGDERVLCNIEGMPRASFLGNAFFGGAASGDRLFYGVGKTGTCFTIPDGGKGTATEKTVHPQGYFGGCGYAMSHDGSIVLGNIYPGPIDREEWSYSTDSFVPGTEMRYPRAHTGFNAWTFAQLSEPKYTGEEWLLKHHVSANHFVHTVADLHHYNCTNNRDYVVGRFGAAYLCHMPTNTWYEVVPRNKLGSADCPAVHFYDVKNP